jgi:hypothetical protein
MDMLFLEGVTKPELVLAGRNAMTAGGYVEALVTFPLRIPEGKLTPPTGETFASRQLLRCDFIGQDIGHQPYFALIFKSNNMGNETASGEIPDGAFGVIRYGVVDCFANLIGGLTYGYFYSISGGRRICNRRRQSERS